MKKSFKVYLEYQEKCKEFLKQKLNLRQYYFLSMMLYIEKLMLCRNLCLKNDKSCLKKVFFGFNKIKILLHKKRLILTSQMLFMILLLHKKMTRQNYQKAYVLTPGIFHFVQLLSLSNMELKVCSFYKTYLIYIQEIVIK